MLMQTRPADDQEHGCETSVRILSADATLRASLADAIRDAGLNAAVFESADTFLSSSTSTVGRGCLLLDANSLEINDCPARASLLAAAATMPLVLIVRPGGVPASVRALKAMAVDFLLVPGEIHALVECVLLACRRDLRRSESELRLAAMRARYESLTAREKQVLALVTEGLMNKQVAARLGLQVITVKVHRGTMMRKMRCRRLVELVRAADTLEVESQLSPTMQVHHARTPVTLDSPRAGAR
jgi:FixJ family two-component response regulator